MEVPFEMTALSLLKRFLPAQMLELDRVPVDEWHRGFTSDLWQAARMDVDPAVNPELFVWPLQDAGDMPLDEARHSLREFHVHRPDYKCSKCHKCSLPGDALFGCEDCYFHLCITCYRLHCLRSSVAERFPFSHILHFGKLSFDLLLPTVALTQQERAKKVMDRFVQRHSGSLAPLADPYDYYVRAALLHNEASASSSHSRLRPQLLHDARCSLEAALEAPPGSGAQKFRMPRPRKPGEEVGHDLERDQATNDPRLWYLLGLVLAEMGEFSEAKRAYRQALSRLPARLFAAPMHFNLASLEAVQPGEASRAAALRELKEFRRLCRAFEGPPGGNMRSEPCELCGARLGGS